MTKRYDALVLGAGLEGLAAAATLAQAGRAVACIDALEQPGGVCARRTFHADHSVPGLLHELGATRRALCAGLDLASAGLAWNEKETALWVPPPVEDPEARGLRFARGEDGWHAALGSHAADTDGLARLFGFIERVRSLALEILDEPVPELFTPSKRELFALAQKAVRLRRLGDRDMLELLRVIPSPASDWLGEHIAHPGLRAVLAAPALAGSVHGPRAPGTAGLVLLRACTLEREPVGGGAALAGALADSARRAGVEFLLGQGVRELRVEAGSVRGALLAGGESLDARTVVSTLDPATTFVDLLPFPHSSDQLGRAARQWRTRGGIASLSLACSSEPAFRGTDDVSLVRAISASQLDELELAADALKYSDVPSAPWLDVVVASRIDPQAAPAGKATLSVHIHGVPFDVQGGWTDAARETLLESVWVGLEHLAPGLRSSVVGHELLLPSDLAANYGLRGGHLLGGELNLDQLWIQRPSAALARYRTPLAGLFLAGSSSHPGGNLFGGAGVLGARAVLSS